MRNSLFNHSVQLAKKPIALALSALFLSATIPTQLAALSIVKAPDPVQAFYGSENYTYCDAKLLSAYWASTPWDAKVRAGNKAIANAYDVIDDYLGSARDYALEHNVRCTWQDGNNPDYSYEDASKLAEYWGKDTPWDAKLKIGRMLQDGDNKLVIQALKRAGKG